MDIPIPTPHITPIPDSSEPLDLSKVVVPDAVKSQLPEPGKEQTLITRYSAYKEYSSPTQEVLRKFYGKFEQEAREEMRQDIFNKSGITPGESYMDEDSLGRTITKRYSEFIYTPSENDPYAVYEEGDQWHILFTAHVDLITTITWPVIEEDATTSIIYNGINYHFKYNNGAWELYNMTIAN